MLNVVRWDHTALVSCSAYQNRSISGEPIITDVPMMLSIYVNNHITHTAHSAEWPATHRDARRWHTAHPQHAAKKTLANLRHLNLESPGKDGLFEGDANLLLAGVERVEHLLRQPLGQGLRKLFVVAEVRVLQDRLQRLQLRPVDRREIIGTLGHQAAVRRHRLAFPALSCRRRVRAVCTCGAADSLGQIGEDYCRVASDIGGGCPRRAKASYNLGSETSGGVGRSRRVQRSIQGGRAECLEKAERNRTQQRGCLRREMN